MPFSFDLDSMTLILIPDLDMIMMQLHSKNEVPNQDGS